MSVYYDLYPSGDVKQTGEEQPLYPRVVAKGTIDKEEFLEHVSRCQIVSNRRAIVILVFSDAKASSQNTDYK